MCMPRLTHYETKQEEFVQYVNHMGFITKLTSFTVIRFDGNVVCSLGMNTVVVIL